jgi:hypothetical protein
VEVEVEVEGAVLHQQEGLPVLRWLLLWWFG